MSNTKRKVGNQKCNGLMTEICRIYSVFKSNPIGAIIFAFGALIFTGIFNSLFGNFFTSCSEVMSNASVGFWRKFVDLYYAMAAKAELTDASEDVACGFYCLMIGALWVVRDAFKKFVVDEMKNLLQEATGTLAKLDNVECGQHDEVDSGSSLQQVRKDSKKLVEACKKKLTSYETQFRWLTLAVTFFAIFFVFDLTLKISSYEKLKDFKKSVTVIRPYITDSEYHMLNRKWVLMNSKADYKNILETLQTYAKRSDAQKASKEVKSNGAKE